jgi:hypothetical protein
LNSNNGGILSNISEGGLCFHAACPVQQNERLRVSFLAKGHRIEADVEPVWADESQKTGGFRFISLSLQAREQIRMVCGSKGTAAEGKSAPSAPKPLVVGPPDAQLVRAAISEAPLHNPRQKLLAPRFFRGFLTGFLISAVLGAALLVGTHPQQFGELLIQLGERFGAKPQIQTVSPPIAARPWK